MHYTKEKRLLRGLKDFSRLLAKRYELKRIYLFGSLAEGMFFKGSDVDIAVEGMDFEDYLKALAEHRSIRKDIHLDILSLELCKSELKETILKEGKVLYEKK